MTFSLAGGRRFGTAVLIASLALNAALGGYLGVNAWRRFQISKEIGTPPGFLRLVRWRLPAADKAILDAEVDKKGQEFAGAQFDAQRAMRVAIASLRRSDFNEADFRAAVKDARDKRLRVSDLSLEVFVDAMAKISPEGRTALVPRRALGR